LILTVDHLDIATVRLGVFPRNGQAETGTSNMTIICVAALIKGIEYAAALRFRDPWTGIGHFDNRLLTPLLKPHAQATLVRRELDSVGKQIVHQRLQFCTISVHLQGL
jgi:hypothetical protein